MKGKCALCGKEKEYTGQSPKEEQYFDCEKCGQEICFDCAWTNDETFITCVEC